MRTLRGADLKFANLEGANLKGANLEGSRPKAARLWRGSRLKGVTLIGASLERARVVTDSKSKSGDSTDALVIEVDVAEDVPDGDVIGWLKQLALSANELHKAYGGSGLKVGRIDIGEPASVPVGGGK